MKIIVLGISGMIGSCIFTELSKQSKLNVFGTLRNLTMKYKFSSELQEKAILFKNLDDVSNLLDEYKPSIIINCIGLTKHRKEINNIQNAIYINSIFPYNLRDECKIKKIRLIHISTDCIFSGYKGGYNENDNSDCNDLYGMSKALGEINDNSSLTIRTSTIGHEFETKHGLLEWFLSQKNECYGYKNAIFSGLTNLELSKIIVKKIIPNSKLKGLYNVGGQSIDKFSLLHILNKIYKKNIIIQENTEFIIDRSLNSNAFYSKTGYNPPDWNTQIKEMYKLNLFRKLSNVKK